MPKTQVYKPDFKKKIVQLYSEQGRTIKSLNEQFQLEYGKQRFACNIIDLYNRCDGNFK